MIRKRTIVALAVSLIAGFILASQVQAQVNVGCLSQAIGQAAAYQCRSEAKLGCVVEKLAVGFGAYQQCTTQAVRQRRYARQTMRLQARRVFR